MQFDFVLNGELLFFIINGNCFMNFILLGFQLFKFWLNFLFLRRCTLFLCSGGINSRIILAMKGTKSIILHINRILDEN